MRKTVRVGSRESLLAVKQAQLVMESIREGYPDVQTELVTIKTQGDKILDKSLAKIGGKGLFIKELEQALMRGEIDIAVHSYKDMPYEETQGLPIVALSEREQAFDALVLPEGTSEIDCARPVGSSSIRRSIQFEALYPGAEIQPIRGNVLTRLEKLDRGEYAAIILAEAGLRRLALQNRISKVFTLSEMIPAASQGILAVQGRAGEDYFYLSGFHSQESETISRAERQYLKTLQGGCTSPVAAYGSIQNQMLTLHGLYVGQDGQMRTGNITGDLKEAAAVGEALAVRLRNC